MVSSVIVPLDGSSRAETALAPAVALAGAFGASLLLVRVVDPGDVTAATAELERIAADARHSEVHAVVRTGAVAEEIAALVADQDDPVVSMSSRGHSGLGAALLGSIAKEVLERVTCPVVLTGPSADPAPRALSGSDLVYAYDGSNASSSLEPVVREWATTLDAPVQVVTVLHRDGQFIGNVDATEVKQLARSLTDRLVAGGVEAELQLLDGLDPARAIADFASNLDAGLVFVASHGHGLSHAVLGSVATRVAHHALCPVVVLRRR